VLVTEGSGLLVVVEVNGQRVQLPSGATVADLLARLGLASASVAVERNLDIVPRAEHARESLADGDRLEIVTLVGGG
jgi:sulfur carrier protein